MIEFPNGGRLVTDLSELPHLDASELFGDFETTSGDKSETSVNPWHNCDILGIAVTADDCPHAWYIPLKHHDQRWNLPLGPVVRWWRDTVERCRANGGSWVNHNVKYDAHIDINYLGGSLEGMPELVCTLVRAKLLDSSRLNYGLDHLSRDWLKHDIIGYYDAFTPYLHRNKDYGAIPGDVMAPYACQDVLSNRRLHKYQSDRLDPQCYEVRDVETQMTSCLLEVEQRGMNIDPLEVDKQEFLALNRMVRLESELSEHVGRHINPQSSDQVYDLLVNQYGLPVLGWTEDGNPSFDKHALAKYAVHPLAPTEVIRIIRAYRSLSTFHTFFLSPYQRFHIDGVLHPDYNQAVQTGRLSCRRPNMQQLNKAAKALIIPPPGYKIISLDYSQIEFRLIVHYTNCIRAIKAYLDDPDTDFHALVAGWCEIHRKPAKTVNFLMGYGGGKERLILQLMQAAELVAGLRTTAEERVRAWLGDEVVDQGRLDNLIVEAFNQLARQRAEEVYDQYHTMLPTLKPTSYKASDVCKRRGYVYNLAGRRRYLPSDRARLAFNSLNQATAADLMKERMVALWHLLRGLDIHLIGQVHDEVVLIAPDEVADDPRTIRDIVGFMEHPKMLDKLRVPIRCTVGVSGKDWRDASSDEKSGPLRYDPSECRELAHLRA